MKKFLISFLLTCSCALTLAAVGCNKDKKPSNSVDSTPPTSSNSGSEQPPDAPTSTITFIEGEGYSFVSEIENGGSVVTGSDLYFTVELGAFYTGTPVVYVNDTPVVSQGNHLYRIRVTQDLTIRAEGVYKETSNMDGMGTFDNAYIVSRPVDLLYIAQQVNAGNRAYTHAYYILANDIDCKGEELEIIGDNRIESAVFSGCFTVDYNPDTGERYDYTISNFTISANNANGIGLFGTVIVDMSTTSSGLLYGIQLDNFHISARMTDPADGENRSLFVGGLVGYGIGANVQLCKATNGVIDVYADDSYFAFAGGLIGYQQAFYSAEYGLPYASEVAYSVSDVDVRVLDGVALYAGGISGYLGTNYPLGSTSFIHHSYATGTVSGALRTGGIVGGLGRYSSVSYAYSTGDVIAKCGAYASDSLMNSNEYYVAMAGGLVGYAENDTIVNDSFSVGKISAYAVSGKTYEKTNAFVAGGDEADFAEANAEKYVVWNCLNDVTPENVTNLTDRLTWLPRDWVITAGSYPTINYDDPTEIESTEITLQFVDKNGNPVSVNKQTSTTSSYLDLSQDSYSPIGNAFFTGSFGDYVADDGQLSFGYYLDKELTQPLPYAYVTAKNATTLYIGFADPAPLLGSYQIVVDNAKPLTVTFKEKGDVVYSDGQTQESAYYYFDGETVTLFNSRLVRYYLGEILLDESEEETADPYFDINRYALSTLKGQPINGEIELFDGVYFTKENPLRLSQNVFRGEYYFTKNNTVYHVEFYGDKALLRSGVDSTLYHGYTVDENGNIALGDVTINTADLLAYDPFKGAWTKSATLNKSYVFDGMGGWRYYYTAYSRDNYELEETLLEQASGSYTVVNDIMTFTHGDVEYTASFDENGVLHVSENGKPQLYYKDNSYLGVWKDTSGFVSLSLQGLGKDGYGTATVTYSGNYTVDLIYEQSETDGYVCLYWASNGSKLDLFGYFAYDSLFNVLNATLYDPDSADGSLRNVSLLVTDDYVGEWICNAPGFENIEFDFGGNGLYDFLYAGAQGSLTIRDGNRVTNAAYTLDSTLSGKFVYNGTLYTIHFDETEKSVSLIADTTVTLERKDPLVGMDFVDLNGNRYQFDGKSNLLDGGKLTVNNTSLYVYKNLGNASYAIYENDAQCGTLTESDSTYTLTVNGTATDLYFANEFMGDWAISKEFATLSIGPTDKNGSIAATFKGTPITMQLLDTTVLTFRYRDSMGMPLDYYVFVVDEETLALSLHANLFMGEYQICSKADELYGVWTSNRLSSLSIVFDGVTSNYSDGTAKITQSGNATFYNYRIRENGIIMWSQELLGGKTLYYKIEFTADVNGRNAYKQGEKAILRTEVDALYLSQAIDENNVTYTFDGMSIANANGYGSVTASNGKTYQYKITRFNTNNTADLILIDQETQQEYTALLDYRVSGTICITLTQA